MFEARGHDVLGHAVQPVCELAGTGSPPSPEELVAAPTEQPCLGTQRVVERHLVPFFEVLAPELDEPAAALEAFLTVRVLDDSIERHVLRTTHHDLAHREFSFHWMVLRCPLRRRRRRKLSGEFRPAPTSQLCDAARRKSRCEDANMTEQALTRARSGDETAFRELTDRYRRELQ